MDINRAFVFSGLFTYSSSSFPKPFVISCAAFSTIGALQQHVSATYEYDINDLLLLRPDGLSYEPECYLAVLDLDRPIRFVASCVHLFLFVLSCVACSFIS